VQDKEAQLACMASWAMEALQCRQPAKSYALYLSDQWLQFQINILAQRGTTPFQNYHQFAALCRSSSSEDRAKLAEFCLHNFALPDINAWDPNIVIGDVQLMAMASWMSHEEKRVVEVRNILDRELSEPLMIKAELDDPSAVISTHQHLGNSPQELPGYIEQ